MQKQDFRTIELIKVVKMIHEWCIKQPQPVLDRAAIKNGLQVSKTTCKQEKFVFATPLMKNLLVYFGDVKQTYDKDKDEWHTEKLACGKKSKAVDWVNKVVHACLVKYNGPEKHAYDDRLGVFDEDHYNVDCWNGFKAEIWDIQPGQAEERAETFKAYGNPVTNFTYEQLLEILSKDPIMQTACIAYWDFYPAVAADKKVHDVSDPFKHKGTGTSYPDYRNDATRVEGKEITYGELCVSDVIRAYERGIDYLVKYLLNYMVYTGYPRNQRGKGRALEAMSRRFNIGINMINAPEMENLKTLPYGTGLKNEDGVREDLTRLGEFCESLGPDYGVYNLDATKWDFNLGYGLILLQNGLRYMKTNGDVGKALVKLRNCGNLKAPFVDGPNGKVHTIYGREMSGYDDTTLGNTNANRIASLYSACSTQKDYTSKVYYPSKGGCIITLGDDLVLILRRDAKRTFCEKMGSLGIKLHNDEKDAFGLFFVQYRVYKDKEGKIHMGYNWPRVLRSELSKEDQKSLGPAGWTISWYQQIAKCRDIPTAFMILTNITAALDKDHLSLNTPVAELKKIMEQEDEAKQASQKGSRKPMTTPEKLTGGNPQALGFKDGKLDVGFFEEIQQHMRDVYNPHFLEDLGFKTPDFKMVH
jgi:hypothetical protein